MYKFKINKIEVNGTNGKEIIIPKKINIIVGPNNSGKSRFLKELRDYISGETKNIKIIDQICCSFPENFLSFDKAYNINDKIIKDKFGNNALRLYSNKPNQNLSSLSSIEDSFKQSFNTFYGDSETYFSRIIDSKNTADFFKTFGPLFYKYMGTEERLTICKEQKNYGMDTMSLNYLSSFKYKNELLSNLSSIVKKLFKEDIYLDSQTLGEYLVFRVGEDFNYVRKESNLSEENANKLFHENKLDDQGDGLKSFVSTFLSLNSEDTDILLLDEPEAFLHPPLARQLGEMIGESCNEETTIFISTHSVEILKGILSKNQDVNVIRITRSNKNKNSFNILNSKTLETILYNPLLRVSRVLEGIFCEKVVLTEAEADELFYQELIEKLFPNSGLFFVHGQNKQTLVSIAKLYQEIRVNYEIITDFDVLRVPNEFFKFLSLMSLNDKQKQKIKDYAEKLKKIIEDSVNTEALSEEEIKKEKKKKLDEVYHQQGIKFFEEEIQKKIKKCFSDFENNHLHILETGELETILEDYGVKYQEKKIWIVEAIEKISQLSRKEILPESRLYKFIGAIVKNTP